MMDEIDFGVVLLRIFGTAIMLSAFGLFSLVLTPEFFRTSIFLGLFFSSLSAMMLVLAGIISGLWYWLYRLWIKRTTGTEG